MIFLDFAEFFASSEHYKNYLFRLVKKEVFMRVFGKWQFFAAMTAFSTMSVAAPADSTPFAFTQEDGTVVTIQEFGDDHYNFSETIDGYLIVGDGNGSYVYADADGKPSKFLAKNADKRTEEEKSFLKSLNQSEIHSKHRSLNGNRFPETTSKKVKQASVMYSPSNKDASSFVMGERFFPVLLVSTADFSAFDSTFISRMFNEEGYKENDYYGSLRDYYISSSGGQFLPTFDIYPIKLPGKFADYNKESKFLTDALDILVERSDFKARASKYETICPFIFLHPLSNDKAKTYSSEYYSHAYFMKYEYGKQYSKNGYTFDSFAFIAQKLENSDQVNMLGTFAHEFSHVLGLSDTYGTNAQGYSTIGPLAYDVMALGLRNGNGKYPPTFSAFERETMGWLTPIEITQTDAVYVLNDISKMQAYAVINPNAPDEYYLIEYRPAVGFDSMMGKSSYSQKSGKNGALIWYIDYNAIIFMANDPNGDESHQRVTVKSALEKNQDYYADFSFVNNSGKAKVSGIFNFLFEGDKRVCFTTDKSKKLDACPEETPSSSSVAESSSSQALSSANQGASSSSQAVPSSSANIKVSSSSQQALSSSANTEVSSSGTSKIAAKGIIPGIKMQVQGNRISVEAPAPGQKRLKFFDALGNSIGSVSFEGNAALVNLPRTRPYKTMIVRLEVNGKIAATRIIK